MECCHCLLPYNSARLTRGLLGLVLNFPDPASRFSVARDDIMMFGISHYPITNSLSRHQFPTCNRVFGNFTCYLCAYVFDMKVLSSAVVGETRSICGPSRSVWLPAGKIRDGKGAKTTLLPVGCSVFALTLDLNHGQSPTIAPDR